MAFSPITQARRLTRSPLIATRVIFVIVCGLFGQTSQGQPELSPVRLRPGSEVRRDTLTVGATSNVFPYSYIDDKGVLTGFVVELFDALARAEDFEVHRVVAPSAEIQRRFRAGEFDCLQVMGLTPERVPYTDFSLPFITFQGAIFVRKNPLRFKSLQDLDGQTIAILGSDSYSERFFRKNDGLKDMQIISANSPTEAIEWVSSGRAAAAFLSRLTALSVIERTHARNVVQLGAPLAGLNIPRCVAVHEGDAVLLARINEGLAILYRNGEFDRIYQKWFGRFDTPGITREEMIIGIAAALAVISAAAMWGLLHQRALRKRIAGQTRQLAENEALFRILYDNIPMGMSVLEATGDGYRFVSINRQTERFFGLTANIVLGETVDRLPLSPDWKNILTSALNKSPEDVNIHRSEHTLSSQRRDVVVTLVRLAAAADGSRRVCLLVEDVTERRRLDQELAQTRKLRAVGELVGGIAHEFNNLLTPVLLETDAIRAGWPQDLRLHREIEIVGKAAQRGADLTRRLLAFSRKDKKEEAEEVRLESAVSASFALLRQTFDRRIVCDNAVSADLPPLFLNVTDVNQILLNLFINAKDTLLEKLNSYSAQNWVPSIRVEAELLPPTACEPGHAYGEEKLLGWQRLMVHDNGMGMPAEVRERIFEPFYTTKEVGKGTGLGLATVWHLTTEVGGRIEVESTWGLGTTFHVFFP
ncbi:MAG TPA: transporter substrate-binding domain-containing protein, partial [Opitutaceae bacterium]|nr:transporter substrate-binding domain-containing protein [Opitutaceae bacterium]